MGWASSYISDLRSGQTVFMYPRGGSMRGLIESGQRCRVEPVCAPLEVGHIVLCTVRGRDYLHLVKAIQGERVQIGNNLGRINGWIHRSKVHGRCVEVSCHLGRALGRPECGEPPMESERA